MKLSSLVFLVGCYAPTRTAPPAFAVPKREPAEPASWTFDADAAVAYARDHAPALRDRADAEAIAEAGIGAAHQLSNPELHLGETSDDQLIGSTQRFVVAIRLHPDNPWALDAKIAQARAGVDVERAQTAEAARALEAQIRQTYAQLAFGDATRALLDKELAVLGNRAAMLHSQVQVGQATQLEGLLSDEDVAEIEATRSQIELAMAKNRAQLGRLIGIPAGQAWTPTWDFEALRQTRVGLDREALVRQAVAGSPDLAEAAARADVAGAAAYQDKTQRVPWITSLQIERSVRDTVEWAVAATVSLPIFSFNSGKIAVDEAQRRHFHDARARFAEDLRRQIDEAVDVVEATGKRATALAARLEPQRKDIAALFDAERTAATADPVKLLLLEEHYVRAQRAVLDAQYDHRVALIALDALVGR